MKIILVNDDVCTSCRICELACSFIKEGEFNPKKARIHVVSYLKEGLGVPMLCLQCEKPLCVDVCPVDGALVKNPKTGVVELNNDLCIECRACVSACPFGGIGVHPDLQSMMKCDYCGGSPECVRLCPTEALQYVNEEDAALIKKKYAAQAIRKSVSSPDQAGTKLPTRHL